MAVVFLLNIVLVILWCTTLSSLSLSLSTLSPLFVEYWPLCLDMLVYYRYAKNNDQYDGVYLWKLWLFLLVTLDSYVVIRVSVYFIKLFLEAICLSSVVYFYIYPLGWPISLFLWSTVLFTSFLTSSDTQSPSNTNHHWQVISFVHFFNVNFVFHFITDFVWWFAWQPLLLEPISSSDTQVFHSLFQNHHCSSLFFFYFTKWILWVGQVAFAVFRFSCCCDCVLREETSYSISYQ